MCDTAKCAACRPAKKQGMFWWMVGGVIEAAGVGLWWLLRRVVAPGLVALGWAAYMWCSGAQWQSVDRRYLKREVRATGQTLLVVVPALALWQPTIVATVLAVTGGGLVASALVWRNRVRLRQLAAGRFPALERGRADGPIRVRAEVGTPRRLTHGGDQ